jgi:hypothetical protein
MAGMLNVPSLDAAENVIRCQAGDGACGGDRRQGGRDAEETKAGVMPRSGMPPMPAEGQVRGWSGVNRGRSRSTAAASGGNLKTWARHTAANSI